MTRLEYTAAVLAAAALMAGFTSLVFSGRELSEEDAQQLCAVEQMGVAFAIVAAVLLIAQEVAR
ncbi:MAG: hypothetical protein AB1941_10055 [Gemmatimonadota bacterium]